MRSLVVRFINSLDIFKQKSFITFGRSCQISHTMLTICNKDRTIAEV